MVHVHTRAIILVLAAFAAAGCATAVDPIIGEGVLDSRADMQRVRVFSIEAYPGIDGGETIDAAVSSTDLSTGVRREYEATNIPPLEAPEGIPIHPAVFHPVEVPHDGEGTRVADGVWAIDIDMYEDTKAVFAEYARNCLINRGSPDIALRGVELRFVIASADWSTPSGIFDPDDLVEPNRLSNVENGYGFIGAGELYRYRWTPSATVRYQLGYRYRDMGAEYSFNADPPFPCFDQQHTSVWDMYF